MFRHEAVTDTTHLLRYVASHGDEDCDTVEELSVPQRAGEKRFATIVQLLENERGERLLRFAYSTGGTARRGPVTLRGRDLERLRAALAEHPQLAEVLAMT